MSWFYSILRFYKTLHPPTITNTSDSSTPPPPPIRFGILSTAEITFNALILPKKSHPEVVITAIAGRDEEKTRKFAKRCEKVLGGDVQVRVFGGRDAYVDLLNDPDVDVIYIPLPNGYHYEWAMKSLEAGKHVLVEKPITNTPQEAERLHAYAEERGLVLLEAMHIRFHPSMQRVKDILDSGELGAIKHVSSRAMLPAGVVSRVPSESDFKAGKGSTMGLGCYAIDAIRFITRPTSMTVESTTHTSFEGFPELDTKSSASLVITTQDSLNRIRNGTITADLKSEISVPKKWGFIPDFDLSFEVECEHGKVRLTNYMAPHMFHKVVVTHYDSDASNRAGYGHGMQGKGQKSRVERHYAFSRRKGVNPSISNDQKPYGEEWWSTYRYQLDAFVDRIRGREVNAWYTKEDSVENMKWVVDVYKKMGLSPRPLSDYYLKGIEEGDVGNSK